ncbi:hypothetical protein COU78_02985 [Candidatus Peregrinibacteria bacterium CG10_big_fil_rev_8_21_14_0_10_49_24]|nr:MAG: hypothetical protein COV83_06820 [Candidatus Peregrinibacteria bacterium CG11_big_fil_rev_8_21_14_0_20_49_14]PIR51093.1 MAG: hypothetical protein COU78_02985 [Candidatus Peregrinibacteria bacterium CG10_big_fil_rev_8_21_14_0_10_49_24]PJA67646.1 MAG: hypothetical protein CO157_04465 [Candidatus Peregrinibacteria bacterium CG_4_9_14_3_um_filter_49_12]
MSLTLSWDLFVIVFFAIVITYSFIIGKHESVKIIISTYIAIVAAQGMGNLIERLSTESQPLFNIVGLSLDIQLLATTKLLLFIVTIVFLAVRGGFEIEYQKEGSVPVDIVLTALFGFVTAGLMLSTLMTFVADAPLLDKNIAKSPFVISMVGQSRLMELMVLYQDLWFSLPAVILLVIGFMHSENEE